MVEQLARRPSIPRPPSPIPHSRNRAAAGRIHPPPHPADAVTNKDIAKHLKLAADLIALSGGNPFRARAFGGGARRIERLPEAVADIDAAELTTLDGIGKGLAADITEIVETGGLALTDKLLAGLPPGLPDVLRVKGLGVKKVRALWQGAGVTSLDDLEAAAASGKLAALDGFGAKTVQNILAGIETLRSFEGKVHLAKAYPPAAVVARALRNAGHRAEVAGATARQCNVVTAAEVVTDADADAIGAALERVSLTPQPGGDAVRADAGIGVPLVVWRAEGAFGTERWRRTASEAHREAFVAAHGAPGAADTMDDVYTAAGGIPALPPPLQEDDRWLGTPPPDLVTMDDLRGTVHNHTTASDGAHSLSAMCEAARARGWSYFGVCDHSQSLQVAHGLSPAEVEAQIEEVEALNDDYAAQSIDFRVFSGSEVDILRDGSLDFEDDLLARLDVVVASVHTHFRMTESEATERIVRAVSNPHVAILGHPTGRLLLRRDGYPIDHLAVLDACVEHGVAVELNASPWRLDLDWTWIPAAVERGVMISINPDAHSTDGLDAMRWGVAAAQKGGLTAAQSLTCLTADAFAGWLAARR